MIALTLTFCGIVLTISAFVWFVSSNRVLNAVVLVFLYAGLYWGWGSIQGWPKFISITTDETRVLAYSLKEDEAIYVWVDEGEPRAYRLPWDMEMAKQLRQAGQQAAERGGGLMMHRRRGFPEGERVFYPEPVEELPPKQ